MNPTTSTMSYYPALDGLRGIAILLVLCCHNLNFLPHFEFGWVGVDLFFVLSGFLITDILLKARESKNFLQNFYIRRILKIFPLYYGVLLVFFLVAPFFQNLAVQCNYYNQDQPMSWMHLQNWLYITHQMPTDLMPLGHFWSLSVEEQFYFFWPFVVFVVHSTRHLKHIVYIILITCIASRFSSWLTFGNGYTNFYFQYMTRLDGLCIGSLIAIWRFSSYEQTKKYILRLGFVVLSIQLVLLVLAKTIFTNFPHFKFIGYTSIAAIFGIIIFYAIEKRNAFSKLLLENSFIQYIGKISYGLYVYHWPILVLFKIYLLDKLVIHGYSSNSAYITVSLTALAVTVPVSIASYHLFEKKILALKDVITSEGFFARVWKKLLLFFNTSSAR
jgi:peptidoglycan/LPS O-acetylase OafA/YrhL